MTTEKEFVIAASKIENQPKEKAETILDEVDDDRLRHAYELVMSLR